jgi:2,3-bisphosphoglycerate-dependent phosphoglycerate mutase
MPKKLRIFIVRHAESEANLDLAVNQRMPDFAISITKNGKLQSNKAGTFLAKYINDNVVGDDNIVPYIRLWRSPYQRTRQTSDEMLKVLGVCSNGKNGLVRDFREKDSLIEQDFGIFEGLTSEECAIKHPVENERYLKSKKWKGQYWAKMPLGESRANVSDRLLPFISTLIRDTSTSETRTEEVRNVIVVTHGVTSRCLIKEYLNKKYEWIQDEPNPKNCSIRLIEDGKDKGYIFEGF